MKMLRNIAATVALLSAATSAAAFTSLGTDRFIDVKTGFRVQVSRDGDTMLLDGRQPVTHETFHIAVVGDKVTGVWAGQPVNYTLVSDKRGTVTGIADASQLASR